MDVDIDWRAVGLGAAAGFAMMAVVGVLSPPRDSRGDAWNLAITITLLLASSVAGLLAGRRCHDQPYAHGLLAGLGTLALVVLATVIREPIAHQGLPSIGSIVPAALFAMSFGIVGGVVGARRGGVRNE